MFSFESITDLLFLDRAVLEQIETANTFICPQNRRIYFICSQTGIVQADCSGHPSLMLRFPSTHRPIFLESTKKKKKKKKFPESLVKKQVL